MKAFLLSLPLLAFLHACSPAKKTTVQTEKPVPAAADSQAFLPDLTPLKYSATRLADIIHTRLEVKFDWQKQHVLGKADLILKPHFYPQKEIVLDAKEYDIHSIHWTSDASKKLKYDYDKETVTIYLDKEYKRTDTLRISIDYTAKPNERKAKTGQAITSDKGLYFINPTGTEKDKPVQIWTQGEPEANSCWFPTVDKPNERMTHEIFITIDSAHKHFTTLSNGLLISSKKNPDGSRTDHWKQALPAAPYLVMMAIGDYAVVKDKWKNLQVDYYVEREYEAYAKATFGNTPEMLEFFSKITGLPYPWEKYAQVVVRDYVSGAMENTSAVIFGEFMNQTDREMLDNNHEDVISHELFHHWFGDYVTCESWSNLTMNEGFATYGEYLWREHKYGVDDADMHRYESAQGYFASTEKNPKDLIRYRFGEPDEMFDGHSYNKGGAVLHMLRKHIGDEAFFLGLKSYLEQHKYSAVEAHDLRLIFEKVTGQDLKWFFDQWFFDNGHPQLEIRHNYIDSLKTYVVSVSQKQDFGQFPVFRLPVEVDIYSNGKSERKHIVVTKPFEEFSFPVERRPDFVNFDAEKVLLCNKEEKLSLKERVFQYKNAPLYADRLEALKECATLPSIPEAAEVILLALQDKNEDIRERAINLLEKVPTDHKSKIKEILKELAVKDPKSAVRAAAIEYLASNYQDEDLLPVFRKGVNDPSYAVIGRSLSALGKRNSTEAMEIAQRFESEKSIQLQREVAQIYAKYGNDSNQPFFVQLASKSTSWGQVAFANTYTEFLKRCSDSTINAGLVHLEKIGRTEENRWIRYFGIKGIKDLTQMYSDRETSLQEKLNRLKSSNPDTTSKEYKQLEKELTQAQGQKQKLTTLYNELQSAYKKGG